MASLDAAGEDREAQLVKPIEHLLKPPAVWIDPPPELGDEVVDAVLDEFA